MGAAIICVISLAALAQFSIFYLRAIIAATAAEPLSDRMRGVAGVDGQAANAGDFAALLKLHEVCPEVDDGGRGLGAVRTYYRAIAALRSLCGSRFPAFSAWAQREMATCSQYVAVLLDQRIERNLACQAELNSW